MALPWHVALRNLAVRRFGDPGFVTDLARRAHMPIQSMSLYLRGERVPSIEQLQRILDALDADLADLQVEMDKAAWPRRVRRR